jgi:SCF-associated factor 1
MSTNSVDVPTEVRFDDGKKPKNRFCLAVAAGGWHTGALVIDTEPDDGDSDEELMTSEPEPMLHPPPHNIRQPGETPPFMSLPGVFRIGLAAAQWFSGTLDEEEIE